MDPTGIQNRLSGGKRRKDAYSGEEEVVHDNEKMSRRWMSGRGDEIDSKDHLEQVNQALDFRGMSVDHWMRLQQQKMEPAAPTTPMNLQQPINLQRSMAVSIHDIRSVDSSKQASLASPSPQQLTGPQQSAHQQHPAQQLTSQQLTNQQLANQQLTNQQLTNQQLTNQQLTIQQLANQQLTIQQLTNQQLTNQQLTNQQLTNQQLTNQQLTGQQQQQINGQQQQLTSEQQNQQQLSSQQQQQLTSQQQQQLTSQQQHTSQLQQQQPNSSGGQVHKFQHLDSEQIQQHLQMPYPDLSNSSRPMSTLPPLPLSFRPPPIFAESDLRHSPTSSSSNQYPLQNVMSHQQRLPPQGSPLLPDSDEDRYSSMLSGQSSLIQQQPQGGMAGASNSLVIQEMQASAAWYPSMRDIESQPMSSSRLGRASLSNGQNVGQSLYSSPTLSDLTTQSGLAPLPYQSCSGGTSFRESPGDQDLLGDQRSSLAYGISGSSSSSVVGPKCSSLPRINNKPVFQTDFPRRGVLNGPYCPSSSGDLLSQNMAGGMPDESCYIPRAPPPKPVRTYTKVYKLGAIGRALDVTRFTNYTDLRCELARMFNLEGQLDQRSGWQLVFLDNENDILLLGDDPWDEFVTSVRGIRILSPTEVFLYMNEERFGGAPSTLNPGTLKQY